MIARRSPDDLTIEEAAQATGKSVDTIKRGVREVKDGPRKGDKKFDRAYKVADPMRVGADRWLIPPQDLIDAGYEPKSADRRPDLTEQVAALRRDVAGVRRELRALRDSVDALAESAATPKRSPRIPSASRGRARPALGGGVAEESSAGARKARRSE